MVACTRNGLHCLWYCTTYLTADWGSKFMHYMMQPGPKACKKSCGHWLCMTKRQAYVASNGAPWNLCLSGLSLLCQPLLSFKTPWLCLAFSSFHSSFTFIFFASSSLYLNRFIIFCGLVSHPFCGWLASLVAVPGLLFLGLFTWEPRLYFFAMSLCYICGIIMLVS